MSVHEVKRARLVLMAAGENHHPITVGPDLNYLDPGVILNIVGFTTTVIKNIFIQHLTWVDDPKMTTTLN